MDNKKIIGGTVATTFPVPTKLSDLIDDTGDFLNPKPIAYANHSKTSEYADKAETASVSEESRRDSRGNNIYETYATKEEVPTKISQLVDDTSKTDFAVKWAENALFSNHAAWSDNAGFVDNATHAYNDEYGNNIHGTYATKAELTAAIGEALEGDY